MICRDWLDGVAELLVRANGVLARLGEPDYVSAKAARVLFDLCENAGDDIYPKRPFFVLAERKLQWVKYGAQEMAAVGVVEVLYTETALQGVSHKAAKRHFADFVGDVFASVAELQGQPIAGVPQRCHLALSKMRMVDACTRATIRDRDPGEPATDYWWTAWWLYVGAVGGPMASE